MCESIDPTTGRNNADRYYRTNEISGYVQDKWQVRTNLSITAGVRYDYHGGMTENTATCSTSIPLFTTSPGPHHRIHRDNAGFVIAGNNKQPHRRASPTSTLNGRQWGISPRLGFAWSPEANHGNVVFSGGAGMYYDRGELFSYLSQPAGGSIGGPFGVTESSPAREPSSPANRADSGLTLENPMGDLAFSTPAQGGIYTPAQRGPRCRGRRPCRPS